MNYSKKNKLWYAFAIAVLIGLFVSYSVIYKTHEEFEGLELTFIGSANNFEEAIQENPEGFVNAIVQLKGKISFIDLSGATLSNSVFCQFKEGEVLDALEQNTEITIKGRYIGYDDLLEEIKLDQCILIKPE